MSVLPFFCCRCDFQNYHTDLIIKNNSWLTSCFYHVRFMKNYQWEEINMCGIVGYSGTRPQAVNVLLQGLQTLEYRGYDSSGIAVFTNGAVNIIKSRGKVSELKEKLKKHPLPAVCGIAHTRWATHGEPSETNAHPHRQGQVTLVHNGIIENYHELSEELYQKGYRFYSQTDTEIACACIDAAYRQMKDPLRALQVAQRQLKGSYAFAVLFDDHPDVIYAMRCGSPLIAAASEDASFVASDIPALLAYTRSYLVLDEKDIAVLHGNSIALFDAEGKKKKVCMQQTSLDLHSIQKEGYAHFMLKEIHEEAHAVETTLHSFAKEGVQSKDGRPFALKDYRAVSIVACGSAYHAGMIAKELIESEARVPVQLEVASEFRYRNPLLPEKTLVILISQSGETADTLAALRLAKEMQRDTLAVVNVVGSSLAREADFIAYTMAGPEIAVATTKAYAAQVALLSYMTLQLANSLKKTDSRRYEKIIAQFDALPDTITQLINRETWNSYAEMIAPHQNAFFIGRGLDHALCLEGSLKLKEISYIHSEAYAAGELKHGTISLIEQGTPVIAIVTEPQLFDKTISNIREVKARGACVILICREDFRVPRDLYDAVVLIPACDRMLQGIVVVAVLQMIAYHTACLRGCEIDQPRNLAKSVTVE